MDGGHADKIRQPSCLYQALSAKSFARVPAVAARPSPSAALAGLTLGQAEELLIRTALEAQAGNRERAAKALGISERTLYRKIIEYGLR